MKAFIGMSLAVAITLLLFFTMDLDLRSLDMEEKRIVFIDLRTFYYSWEILNENFISRKFSSAFNTARNAQLRQNLRPVLKNQSLEKEIWCRHERHMILLVSLSTKHPPVVLVHVWTARQGQAVVGIPAVATLVPVLWPVVVPVAPASQGLGFADEAAEAAVILVSRIVPL